MKQNELDKEQEPYFQNMQKEVTLETLNYRCSSSQFERSKTSHQKRQSVTWKFQQIPSTYIPKANKFTPTKNISFQNSKEYLSDCDDEDQQQFQQSQFQSYYANKPNVYKKKYNFGTNLIGKRQYFASVFVNPNKIQKHSLQYYVQDNDNLNPNSSRDVVFDSEFESGNLLSAFKISQWQYDLILQNDINTKGNTQWFYFRIINLPKNTPLKINIVNLRKSDSLFNYGMLPCLYSMQEDIRSKRGWVRSGKNVKYFRNDHQIQNSRRNYSTLTFIISTQYDNDVLKVAQCYPYTYTDLNNYIDSIERIKYKKQLMERQTIMNTLGRNKIQALNIKQNNPKIKTRPLIFIMARQHPGQTPASYICEGIIDYLLSKQKESEYLRKNYEIIVIPMVNPDGVCAGNYRTNLYGFDLNRRWDGSRIKNVHECTQIKKYMSQISKGRQIAMILDIHGHSRKLFSFFYGNKSSSFPTEVRLFPYICSKIGQNFVRFQDSTFLNEQQKRNTARIQLHYQFKVLNVLTFQASFFGYYGKDRQKKHFTIQGYKQLGSLLSKAIHINLKGKSLIQISPDNRQIAFYKKCLSELRNNVNLINSGEKQNSGSQSSPEECEVKQSQQQKLDENDLYNKDPQPKSFKINRKIVKRQVIKTPIRSQRKIQIIDLAQVNSIFPNNILALIPNSFINKKKKVTNNMSVQTDVCPVIQVYQICKKQDSLSSEPQKSAIFTRQESTNMDQSSPQRFLRSNLFQRPKSQSINRKNHETISGFSGMNKLNSHQRSKTNQFMKTISSEYKVSQSQSKVSSRVSGGKTQDKIVQTTMTFNCKIVKKSNKMMDMEAMKILQFKTIDASRTMLNNMFLSRQKRNQRGEKQTQIAILQHIKLRKKSKN